MGQRKDRKRQPVSHVALADQNLAVEQYRSLNSEFYDGFDSNLFEIRLMVLCLAQGQSEAISVPLGEGVAWGELKLASDYSSDDLQQYAEMELLALHHHLCETVLRLAWVLLQKDPCPWLALARFRSPTQLRRVAERYLDGEPWAGSPESRRNGHACALYGCSDLATTDDARLPSAVDRAIEWIEEAARTVLDAPLYNAYKHGLTVLPSPEYKLSVGPADGTGIEMLGARGYRYLELKQFDPAVERWHWARTQTRVDFGARATACAVLTLLMNSILAAGKRSAGLITTAEHQLLPAEMTTAYARSKSPAIYTVQSFSDALLYYRQPEPAT